MSEASFGTTRESLINFNCVIHDIKKLIKGSGSMMILGSHTHILIDII